jgi:uncharacterized protein (TIGR02302 family)
VSKTDPMAEPSDQPASTRTKPKGISPLQLKLVQAGLTLSLERAWPWLILASTITAFFLAIVWFGLLIPVPPIPRIILVFLFVFAWLLSLLMAIQSARATFKESILRLDRDSGLDHHPVSALFDTPALPSDDPAVKAVWQRHQQQATASLGSLKVRPPALDLAARDPLALRFIFPLMALAGYFVAYPDHQDRLESAFRPDWDSGPVITARLDGWIDPPAYTRIPPIMMELQSDQKTAQHAFKVPEGSMVVIRSSDTHSVDLTLQGGLSIKPADPANQTATTGETRLLLQSDASLTLRSARVTLPVLTFEVIKDHVPSILWREQPVASATSLQLSYHASDDYGVRTIEGRVSLPKDHDAKLDGLHPPLIEAPRLALTLPPDPREGDARAKIEAMDSPWAGIPLDLTLHAIDDKGQEAATEAVTVKLPQRVFGHPLARALIEQRRLLALNPDGRKRVLDALDAVALAPDHFSPDAGLYLVLRDAIRDLRKARTDADLVEVTQALWAAAVTIEERDQGDEKKALDAAREALKKALERGASPDEIKALSEQLKAALDTYLKSLAAKARPAPDGKTSPSGKTIRPEELQAMIDRMNELAKNGALDDAARMMEALNDILDQLQMAGPSMGDPSEEQMNEALDALDALMRDQRTLRDDTFQQGRRDPSTGPKPDPKTLAERQKQLRQQLDALRQGLKDKGAPDPKSFGEADEAMQGAEGALDEGDHGDALASESQALDAMRQGAQSLLKELQGNGQGQSKSSNGQSRSGEAGSADSKDPLGRTRTLDSGDGALRQGGKDGSLERRSRDVVEELRRRLSDPERAKEERDYLRRLLEQE